MKTKFFALAMAFVMAMALTGCSANNEENSAPVTPSSGVNQNGGTQASKNPDSQNSAGVNTTAPSVGSGTGNDAADGGGAGGTNDLNNDGRPDSTDGLDDDGMLDGSTDAGTAGRSRSWSGDVIDDVGDAAGDVLRGAGNAARDAGNAIGNAANDAGRAMR